MMTKKKLFIGTLSFLTMAGILALMLNGLNWLPTLIKSGYAKQYTDIEEVKRDLGIKNVPVPTYFPENISWPPSIVIAQGHPYPAIAMEFGSSDIPEKMLVIVRSPNNKRPLLAPSIDAVSETVQYELSWTTALLTTGACRGQRPCSMLTWEEAGQQTSVLLYDRPFELIKIAESMHPRVTVPTQ